MTDAVATQLITSAATIATLIITHFLQKRSVKNVTAEQTATIEKGQAGIAEGVQQVHVLANDRLTQALNAKEELEKQLRELGQTPRKPE